MVDADEPVRVFISYAHQDSDHQESVRQFWMLLRSFGIDARLDVAAATQREFWPAWMSEQIREARFVLVVASAAYRERGEDRGDRSVGKGVRWEARQLMERWYADQQAGLRSILPVVLPGGKVSDLPDWLLPAGGTTYRVDDFTLTGVESLLRVLTDQPLDVEPPLGPVPSLPTRSSAGTGRPTPVAPAPVAHGGLRTELLIEARLTGQELTCEVTLAGAPLCRREVTLPTELTGVWGSLSAGPLVAQERLASAGRVLTRVVFDETGQRLVADLAARLRPQDELEVVWRAEGAALAMPVELLRLTTTEGEDLGPWALIGGVSVRRQVGSAYPGQATAGLAGPLRVLAAVAAPEESRTASVPLDVEAEMQALLDSVGDLAAGSGGQVRILEVASLSQITAALRETDFHVLHLSAHGSPSSVELEDEDGNPRPVGCRDLMNAIRDAKAAVPLIVLSSCAGAAGGGEALAAALVEAGADRVLAMQASVTDTYATQLLAQFYRELESDGSTRTADALARARRVVERARRTGDKLPLPEYAVPTLLCAGADTPLIDADRPLVPLPPVAVPSGTSVRDLPVGQLIGRRAQLREATAVLRRTAPMRDAHGAISGVQLVGIGGIGKTAVAGRLVTRLRGDMMLPVVHEGRWNPSALFADLAATLASARANDPFAAALASPETPDTAKVPIVGRVLATVPVLLVFDDFEQNLSPGGARFLDPAFDEVFTGWCEAADVGAILVTCRYPLPGDERCLVPVPVGALSPAELRRLLLRLPALRGLTGEDLRLLIRTIGGHPRLIEYVDALLRGRPARFRQVQTKLRTLARREGIDLGRPRPVGVAIEDALLLGSADILLDELLDLLTEDEREVLRQVAVSRAPMSLEDLAYALTMPSAADSDPIPTDQPTAAVEHLRDLTLLAPGDDVQVHPWTGELLDRRPDPDRTRRHEQALRMRLRRLDQDRFGYDDMTDLVRHLAATDQYDQIPTLARAFANRLPGVLAASAFLAEVRPLIPRTNPAWTTIAKQEYEAVRAAGDLHSAQILLGEMREIIDRRISTGPDDKNAIADLSVLLVDLGDIAVDTGNLTTAHDHYQAALDIAQRLATTDPSNTQWQRDLSISWNNLGDLAVTTGDLTTAHDHYQADLDIAQRLATTDPSNTEWQRDLSVSHAKLGNVAVATGDLATAHDHYQTALDIAQRLATTDPSNTEWQRDLSISHNKLGDLAVTTGNLTTAHDHYQAALDIRQRLATTDPSNTQWQRDLSISHENLGDLAVTTGNLTTAHDHYQAALDIRQRLATTDPSNTQWQRDLSISHNKLGDLAVTTGNLTTAHDHYQAALDIAQRLATTDPSNTEWQRDLSISHENLGNVAVATGDLTTARNHYQADLDIAQRLATTDPSNTQWQRDLSISHNKLGDLAVTTGDPTTARNHYQHSLGITQRLATTDPTNTQWQRDLAALMEKMRTLEAGEG